MKVRGDFRRATRERGRRHSVFFTFAAFDSDVFAGIHGNARATFVSYAVHSRRSEQREVIVFFLLRLV